MGKTLKDTHKGENRGINHLMRYVIGQSLGGIYIILPVFLLTVSINKMAFSINCIPDIIVVSRVSLI
jgi:hypothetical protein